MEKQNNHSAVTSSANRGENNTSAVSVSEKPNKNSAPKASSPDGKSEAGSWVYSDTVKDHFLNPRNFLMGDESAFKADAVGLVGNPICGDQMKMFLQIDRETDKITDIKWKTYGCASAIASTSALSELTKGKTLDEALQISAHDIDDYLGNLPKHKFHCSILGHDALRDAISNYRAAKNRTDTGTPADADTSVNTDANVKADTKAIKKTIAYLKSLLPHDEKIAIFGAGAYGTALGGVLEENGYKTSYYDPFCLPTTREEVLDGASYILLSVPSKAVAATLKTLPRNLPLIVATKGILNPEIFGDLKEVMAISGPGFADDIKSKKPTLLTSTNSKIDELFATSYLTFDHSRDFKGVLLCGALKNVYALSAGLKGLERNSAPWQDFIEKALAEMRKILQENQADPETTDLACGIGDLKLTCGLPSRNYAYGLALYRHETPPQNTTVEGVSTLDEIKRGALKIPSGTPLLHELLTTFPLEKPNKSPKNH